MLDEAESVARCGAAIRDAQPLGAAPEEAVWRVSVRPERGAGAWPRRAQRARRPLLLDWGGGLVWIAGPATAAAHAPVVAAARAARGTFTLFRAPEPLRAAVRGAAGGAAARWPPSARRVKAALDPAGVLNPGPDAGGIVTMASRPRRPQDAAWPMGARATAATTTSSI